MLNSARNTNAIPPKRVSPSLQPGSIHSLQIEKLVAGGLALARQEGQVILSQGGIPGETAQIKVVSHRRGVYQGKIQSLTTASSHRVTPVCPKVGECGGCQLQHIQDGEQVRQKGLILEDAMRRIGKLSDLVIPSPVPSPQALGYRQVLRLAVQKSAGAWNLGFYQHGTKRIVPVSECFLVEPPFRTLIAQLANALGVLRNSPGVLYDIEVRYSAVQQGFLVVIHGSDWEVSHIERLLDRCFGLPHVKGCLYQSVKGPEGELEGEDRSNPVIRGDDHLWEEFLGLRVKIGYRSFMQANWKLFQVLGQTILDWVGDACDQRILELYAGTCPIGMALAHQGARVRCVEVSQDAVDNARESLKENGIHTCRVSPTFSESFLGTVTSGEYDMILLDPPRTGLSQKVMTQICGLEIPRIMYLSCDPPSLARDLRQLYQEDYRIHRIQPFDMFPQTAHVETLVELTR